jgi:hypothetical protein
MNTQHTPGPWHWCDDGDGNKWGSRGLEPAVISGTVEGLVSVYDADARLIAASPDLLAALNDILACASISAPLDMTAYIISASRIKAARAAIAKATGEPA